MSSELRSKALWGALILAVLLRAEYLRELLQTPFGHHVVLDGVFYRQAANHILSGHALAADPGCFRAPLYPFFLAGVLGVFGDHLIVPRVLQMIAGLATVVIVRGIARRTHGERTANVAGFLAAGYGMFIYHEAEILGVALGVMLNALATLLLLEGGRRGSLRWIAGGGLALGLTAVTHATALLLAPVAFFWLLVVGRADAKGALLRRLAVLTLAVTLPVSLATVRNVLATGDLILVATQGGINFYVGNNPEADGRTSLVPGRVEADFLGGEYRDLFEVAAEQLAERDTGRDLSASEINAYWTGRARAWMARNPGDAARLFLSKALLFWTGLENSNNRDLDDQAARFTPILRVFLRELAVLMPFTLLGLLLYRGRGPETGLVIGFVLAYFAAITAFFVCTRFRQPVMALMMPYAAAGAVGLFDSVRGAREGARSLAVPVVLLAVLFAATNQHLLDRVGLVDLSLPNAPFHRYNLAILEEQDGDLEGAVAEYRAAARTHPDDPRIGLNLGRLLLRLNRPDEAIPAFDSAAAVSPEFAVQANGIVGLWAIRNARWDEAVTRFQAILRIDPQHDDAHFALGSAYLSSGRFEEAAREFERMLRIGTRQIAAVRRNLGMAYLELNRVEDAKQQLENAHDNGLRDPGLLTALARAYELSGDAEGARRLRAEAQRPGPGAPPR